MRKISFALVNIAVIMLAGSIQSIAQTELPKVVPLAPNAAALAKYGDIPVSYYTGAVNFSIPLWTINEKSIVLPISLNYHSGGIRLKDYAGWVGLGWSLDAGGVITRQLKDKDDLNDSNWPDFISKGQPSIPSQIQARHTTHEFQPGSPSSPPPYIISTTKGEQFNLTSSLGSIEGYDTEYDIFTYNFLGNTGKFLRTRNGDVVKLGKKSDLQIFFPNGSDQFKIIDPSGNSFYFNNYEIATLSPQVGIYITAWYLNRIQTPTGDEITFSYVSTSVPVIPTESHTIVLGGLSPSNESAIGTTTYNQALLLTRIDFNNAYYVEFQNDNLRPDYPGKRITGLKVFRSNSSIPISQYTFSYSSFDAQRMRLDSVTQKSENQSLPSYRFVYDTYSGSGNKGLTSYDYDHWGFFNGKSNSVLIPKFQYGPVRYSPTPLVAPMQYTFLDLAGADRDPNPTAMKIFSLKEIYYPTGGKTVIESEPNTFEYDSSERVREILPETIKRDTVLYFQSPSQIGNIDWINSVSDINVTVSFVCTGNITDPACILGYKNNPTHPNGPISFQVANVFRKLDGEFVTCGGPQCQTSFTLPPNNNSAISYSSSIASGAVGVLTITLRLEWFETLYNYKLKSNNRFRLGGGLRVKEISEYDVDGRFIKSKRFEYHYMKDTNEDNIVEEHSYGRRMAPPFYWKNHFDKRWQLTGSEFKIMSFHRYASVIPPSISIAYNKVTEFNQDSTGNSIGKVEYIFENVRDSLYQYGNGYNEMPLGSSYLSYGLNGSLLLKREYALVGGVYQPIHETRNSYSTELVNNYFGVKHQTAIWEGTQMGVTSTIYYLFVYPEMREERIHQVSTLERAFDVNDSTKTSTALTTLTYGSNHELPIQKTLINTQGQTEVLHSVYPPDYGALSTSTYGVKKLKELNILTPIEQYTKVNGNITSGTFSSYKELSPFLDKVYVLETLAPITSASFIHSNKYFNTITLDSRYSERITYTQYDTKGNPTELAKTNDGKISYLWGYDKRYPIAEIKNAAFNQVAYSSFESGTNEGNWTFTNPPTNAITAKTGKFVYQLSTTSTLGKSLVPGKYFLEYYSKSPIIIGAAVAPVVVDIATSAPDANGWIYYKKEVTITGSTTLTLSSAGATVYVDEVKVYPAQAFMTTYVFDPLIGVTHMIDSNGLINYYIYDEFNRLKIVRDDKNNILQKVDYHYGND